MAQPIISVRNLTKVFPITHKEPGVWASLRSFFWPHRSVVRAVDNISFEIKEGEFVGFVGPNGAGKTTTLKMLTGILYPTSGEVAVLGFTPHQRKVAYQKKFALVMGQKNQLWWDLPAAESFALNRAIYEIPKDAFAQRLDELTTLLNIKHILNVQVRKLSLGERMKCELTAALIHEPKILFLDEPTIGLDVVSQRAIREFLREYNTRKKATIILTSHYMEDIRRLSSRVIIIDHGKLIYDGDYKELTARFATHKSIEIIFRETIAESSLREHGKVTRFEDHRAMLLVPRDLVAHKMTELLNRFPIEDIAIHETSMEDIVSDIFQGKKTV